MAHFKVVAQYLEYEYTSDCGIINKYMNYIISIIGCETNAVVEMKLDLLNE